MGGKESSHFQSFSLSPSLVGASLSICLSAQAFGYHVPVLCLCCYCATIVTRSCVLGQPYTNHFCSCPWGSCGLFCAIMKRVLIQAKPVLLIEALDNVCNNTELSAVAQYSICDKSPFVLGTMRQNIRHIAEPLECFCSTFRTAKVLRNSDSVLGKWSAVKGNTRMDVKNDTWSTKRLCATCHF